MDAQTGWWPIETAPKDGTPIDLWVEFPEHSKARRIPDARWDVEEQSWRLGEFLQKQFAVTPIATHWQPLPSPPEPSQ